MESDGISSPPHGPVVPAVGSPPPSDDARSSANDALLADDLREKIVKQVIFFFLVFCFWCFWLRILDCRTVDSAFGC